MATNHFTVLELSPHCSEDDIKKSFRRLALQHHPDKGGQKERFQAINDAYEVLRDPVKCARHAHAVLGTTRNYQSGDVPSRCGASSSSHRRESNANDADSRQRTKQHDTSKEEQDTRKAQGADHCYCRAHEDRKNARDKRRSMAEQNVHDQKKQKEEWDAFQDEMRQRRRKHDGKQPGESNAERRHREQAKKEAWKAECRRRRREGEEAARNRAHLNAEKRKGVTTKDCS